MTFGFGLGNCEHLNVLDLNEFDADGTIVVEKIVCKKCGKTNAKVYDVLESQSLWNDQEKCRHGNYKILSYKKLPHDQITCEVICLNCSKLADNLYNLDGLSVMGWEKRD